MLGNVDGLLEGLIEGETDGASVASDGEVLGTEVGLVEGLPVGQNASVSSQPTFMRCPSDTVPTQPAHTGTDPELLGHFTHDVSPQLSSVDVLIKMPSMRPLKYVLAVAWLQPMRGVGLSLFMDPYLLLMLLRVPISLPSICIVTTWLKRVSRT